MTYIRKSVGRAPGNPGTGIQLRDVLVLINTDDIAFMPSPDDKGVVIVDNIVMKPGRYGIGIYMTQGTAEVASAAEGETDQIGFTPSIKFNHPGNSQELREFKVNELNSKFIGIMRYCSGKPADLIGSICNPCKITPPIPGTTKATPTSSPSPKSPKATTSRYIRVPYPSKNLFQSSRQALKWSRSLPKGNTSFRAVLLSSTR